MMPGLAVLEDCPYCGESNWFIIRDNPAYNTCKKCDKEVQLKVNVEVNKGDILDRMRDK